MANYDLVFKGQSAKTRIILYLAMADIPVNEIRALKRHELIEYRAVQELTEYVEYVISEGDPDDQIFEYASGKKMSPFRYRQILRTAMERANVSTIDDLKRACGA